MKTRKIRAVFTLVSVFALMISLAVIMGRVLGDGLSERPFSKENQLIQTLLFHGADEAFGVSV